MHSIEDIIARLVDNFPDTTHADKAMIRRAYSFAKECHGTTRRRSGELFIHHPVEVAFILASWCLPPIIICVGLLHDVVEDCDNVTIDTIEEVFGPEIADYIRVLSAPDEKFIDPNDDANKDRPYEIQLLRNMCIYVLLVKAADRIHNLSTISCFPPEKQLAKARETRDFILQLLKISGIYDLVDTFDNLLYKIEHPERYLELSEFYNTLLASNCVYNDNNPGTDFTDRLVSLKNDLSTINDIHGKDFLVDDTAAALGDMILDIEIKPRSIASLYRQVTRLSENVFRDISTILNKDNTPLFDIVIKIKDSASTPETYKLLEHYLDLWNVSLSGIEKTSYRDSSFYCLKDSDDRLYRLFIRTNTEYWENKIGSFTNDKDFSSLKEVDKINPAFTLEKKRMRVYRRDGSSMWMNEGATVLDFAFALHTELGLKFDYAVIDGSSVKRPANTKLNDGDQVVIYTTDEEDNPKLNWFKFVTTPKATQSLIRHFSSQYNIPMS